MLTRHSRASKAGHPAAAPHGRLLLGATCIAVAVLSMAACRAADDQADDADPNNLIVEAEPTPEVFDPTDPDLLAGVSIDPLLIDAGECFDEYVYPDRSGFLQQITSIVPCSDPHDFEAYHQVEHPAPEGDPFPKDNDLEEWADGVCLDEFEGFVGKEYVLSLLEIGTLTPSFEEWARDGARSVICYVYPDRGGRLRDSVRRSGL